MNYEVMMYFLRRMTTISTLFEQCYYLAMKCGAELHFRKAGCSFKEESSSLQSLESCDCQRTILEGKSSLHPEMNLLLFESKGLLCFFQLLYDLLSVS